MKTPRIGVLGGINMDLVINCDHLARPGETVKGSGFCQVPGGKGANQAVAAARLGGHVTMLGHVGADAFGERLLSGMSADGIDVSRIEKSSTSSTGLAFIVVDANGQNCITFVGGANEECDPAFVRSQRSVIEKLDVALVQLECPMPGITEFIRVAHAASVPVVLNPAPAAGLSPDILSLCSVVTPNESEALALTGVEPKDARSAACAAEKLLGMGCRSVIITMGEAGAFVSRGKGEGHLFPAPRVPVVDTVAAGDVFVGAFTTRLHSGRSFEDSVAFANYAAALSTTRPGAQSSIPSLEKVLEFAKSNGEVL